MARATQTINEAVQRAMYSESIPDRVADGIASAILAGEFKDGERIREEELAARFGVSRTPIRDALSKLERRGLVRVVPRRGAYVIGVTAQTVADLFNLRGAIIGLAGRYFTLRHTADQLAELRLRLKELGKVAPSADPMSFAHRAAWATELIYENCGVENLRQILRDHAHFSSWSMLWQEEAADFLTPRRRREYVLDFKKVVDAVSSKNDELAELHLRKLLFESRDQALKWLAAKRDDQSIIGRFTDSRRTPRA